MRIAIYTRKSRLSEKGESIQNQISICQEYASQSYPDSQFFYFEDEGYSGGNIERPGFHAMMQQIYENQIDVVVCYKLDRISRNVSNFSDILDIFNSHSVAFLSVKEHFDTSSPIGRAMMYISSVFAQLERETIAERIQDNMQKLARTGRWLGGTPPFGFSSEKIEYSSENGMKKRSSHLIPIEKEQKIVAILFEKYLELGSLSSVCQFTLLHKIKTRNHRPFSIKSLKKILTNPVYVKSNQDIYDYYTQMGCDMANTSEDYQGSGLLIMNRYEEQNKKKIIEKPVSHWIIALGSHKGFISATDFLKVQKNLSAASKCPSRMGTSSIALASSLILCPKCGSKMIVTHRSKLKNGNQNYYYKCQLKRDSKGLLCDMENLNGKQVDSILIQTLNQLLFSNQDVLLKKLEAKYSLLQFQLEKLNSNSNQQKELQSQITCLTLQLTNYKSSSASKYIITQIENLDKKLQALKEEKYEILPIIMQQNLIAFATNLDSFSLINKKKYFKALVKSIEFKKEKLIIHLKEM